MKEKKSKKFEAFKEIKIDFSYQNYREIYPLTEELIDKFHKGILKKFIESLGYKLQFHSLGPNGDFKEGSYSFSLYAYCGESEFLFSVAEKLGDELLDYLIAEIELYYMKKKADPKNSFYFIIFLSSSKKAIKKAIEKGINLIHLKGNILQYINFPNVLTYQLNNSVL